MAAVKGRGIGNIEMAHELQQLLKERFVINSIPVYVLLLIPPARWIIMGARILIAKLSDHGLEA